MEPVEQVGLVKPFGVLTTNPLGSESLNATPVKALALGLVNVNVNVDVAPFAIVDGEKLLVSVGGSY